MSSFFVLSSKVPFLIFLIFMLLIL